MADNLSELDDCISEVLKKFQLVSGLQFKLRQEQVIAVKTLLSNRDVFAVLPTGYGKSLIFQCFASDLFLDHMHHSHLRSREGNILRLRAKPKDC